ncbi:Hpt domain-containing protein [Candidatus Neomarinimicrobiota bacterium]
MDDLQQMYRRTLRRRIQALEATRQALASGDPEARAAVQRIAHNLRGSGSTYGYPEITVAAEKLELSNQDRCVSKLDDLMAIIREVAGVTESAAGG